MLGEWKNQEIEQELHFENSLCWQHCKSSAEDVFVPFSSYFSYFMLFSYYLWKWQNNTFPAHFITFLKELQV